jgi:hypothetical protein
MCDDLLREDRHSANRDISEVERRLLVLHEACVEGAAFALVASVCAGNGKAACQPRGGFWVCA